MLYRELTAHLSDFISASGVPREKIVGIGIGMPGFVNSDKGLNFSFLNVKGRRKYCQCG